MANTVSSPLRVTIGASKPKMCRIALSCSQCSSAPSSAVSRSMTEQDELNLLMISHGDGGAVIACQLNRNPKVTGASAVWMRVFQA